MSKLEDVKVGQKWKYTVNDEEHGTVLITKVTSTANFPVQGYVTRDGCEKTEGIGLLDPWELTELLEG